MLMNLGKCIIRQIQAARDLHPLAVVQSCCWEEAVKPRIIFSSPLVLICVEPYYSSLAN